MGESCSLEFQRNTTFYLCSWTNIILTSPTIVLNMSLIFALVTSRDRTSPCNMLLLNLAGTDLLTGIVCMPVSFFFSHFVAEHQNQCDYSQFLFSFSITLVMASLNTATLISIERYVKIFYPFHYASRISLRSVAVSIVISWVMSISFAIPLLAGANFLKIYVYIAIYTVMAIALNLFCYTRMLLRVRKVRLQIQNEAARFSEGNINQMTKRYIYIGGLVILSMLICLSPLAIMRVLAMIGFRKKALRENSCVGFTLVLANSVINPIITCSFCPNVRRKVLKIVTCKFSCKDRNE